MQMLILDFIIWQTHVGWLAGNNLLTNGRQSQTIMSMLPWHYQALHLCIAPPSPTPPHLISSCLSAISLSCSALSIACHALLMSFTIFPSGGTYGRWLLAFLSVWRLKRWASMFTRSEYLVEKYTVALKCSGMSHWYHITTMPTSEFFRTELLQYDNWLTNRDRQTNRQTETK